MSIRYKILLPLLGFLLLAGLLTGVTGFLGLRATDHLSTLAERTTEANEASRAARDRFRLMEDIVGRVGAMTDLIDMSPVSAEFTAASDRLKTLLERLTAIALSERMRTLSRSTEAEARQWRQDAEILLGLRPAREIPTQERMTRRSDGLRQHFDEAIALAGEDARAQIQATSAATSREIWAMLGLGALVVAAGAGTAWWLAGTLALPLMRLTADIERLASGDTDIDLMAVDRRDEIGDIARAVLAIRDISHEDAARQVAATEAFGLREEELRRALLRDLADRFEVSVGGIIGMVSSSATELQATAQTMTATATETATQSTTVAAAAEEASTNVNTVAAAAEQLGSSVQEIGRQVDGSANLAQQAVAEADQTGLLVQELSTAVSRIGDIVGLISKIAGQTNLLALNATIEAARAGEAGRGFAVVASEVKELASQTARATEEISGQIARIQASTSQAVTAIGGITARIQEISGVAISIAAAVEEQGAATQEIVRNVAHASTGTNEVTSNIAGVAQASEETGAAASQVLSAVSELSRQSEHLDAEVARFLATVRAA